MTTTTPSYYSAIQQQFALLDRIEALDGEMTEEVQELFSLNTDRIQDTTEQMLALRDTVVAMISAGDAAIAREKATQAQNQKKLALIDGRLLDAVKILKAPIIVGTRSVSLKVSLATDVFDADLIPLEYQRTKAEVPAVPAQQLPDGTKILAALKKGVEIPGVRKEEREKLEVK